jgi:dTDP-glucose pyrophosphorylase
MAQDVNSARFISNLTKNTVALILAGGRGSRLKDLTSHRAKPAVPLVASSVLSISRSLIASTPVYVVLVWSPNINHIV